MQRIESGAVVPSNEVALALAAALGTDAERIRVDSGLAQLVSTTMQIILKRDPTRVELERLPKGERMVFSRFCAARRGHAGALEACQHVSDKAIAVTQSVTESERASHGVFMRMLQGTATATEIADSRQQRNQVRTMLDKLHELKQGQQTAIERVIAATRDFNDASMQVHALLMRFM